MRVFLALLILSMQPFSVAAQIGANAFINTDLALEVQPTFPQPGEQVTLTLNDYGGSYYGASLEWYKDGVLIPSATNQRSLAVTAPVIGAKETISVVLKMPSGLTASVRQVIAPIYADIIIEPQTHVPGFYKGRALPSAGSTVNLTALLSDGSPLGTNFIYTWRVNEDVLEGGPLRGRNQISFVAPQDKELIISLQIAKPSGDIIANRSIYIASMRPELHFYEVNALYGVETRAIKGNFTMIGNSAVIKAEPYYLDSNVFNQPNILEWKINQTKVTGPSGDPYELTLEKTGYAGRARMEFHVRSTADLLQGARGDFNIEL